jgi:CheY-like chemotaxis protein
MLRILLCSDRDLRGQLGRTAMGRQGIELYQAQGFKDARLLATSLDVKVVMVDRDLPDAAAFIAKLREDAATRSRSVAVLAEGDFQQDELAMLDAGANAILRLPPDATWPDRLHKLLNVPMREEARVPVHFVAEMDPEAGGFVQNLSSNGMLLETRARVALGDELGFRFELPDKTVVTGRGRVVREASPTSWGIEFLTVSDAHQTAIRQFLRSSRLG